jgi:hypothetical protein
MPTILDRLPFYPGPTTVSIPGGPVVPILHDQIVLWVSITRSGMRELPPHARRLPAVLDTGFNSCFLIRQHHLLNWAGLTPAELPWLGSLAADAGAIPLRDADVWIHPNLPGHRDLFSGRPAHRLETPNGIAVWPTGTPGTHRLPLLGVEAIRLTGLEVIVNGRKCHVTMRTPRRFWFF